jgi:hypothetical protein
VRTLRDAGKELATPPDPVVSLAAGPQARPRRDLDHLGQAGTRRPERTAF